MGQMPMMLLMLLPLLQLGSALSADSTVVTTAYGQVQGYVGDAETMIWRGIPYAQPPVGDMRWRSPLPPEPWTGVKPAKQFAADCAQFGPAWVSLAPAHSQAPCHNNMDGCVNWTWSNATSEDCLYANVYRSAKPSPKPRPVIVYFAAGALEWGSANDLENSGLGLGAKPGWQDVVLVTLNYRKGIFGFLASDELRERDARKTAGVFGIQDQTLGLKWVKSSIAAFGGDPDRVTLFGESAGATSVSLHMISPDSRGLFHSALIDSGAFNQWTYRPWEDANDLYEVLVKQLGCHAWKSPLDCMLSKDKNTLLNVSDTYYGNCSLPHKESIVTTQWAPAMDGVVIPGIPADMLVAGKAAPVPVLLGSNKNEGSTFITHPPRDLLEFEEYFNTTFGNKSGRLIAQEYMPPPQPPPPPGPPPSPWHHGGFEHLMQQAAENAVGDFDLRCPTVMAARIFASHQQPTFLYSYDHQPFMSVNEGFTEMLGAFHGAEVPFVFYDDFELRNGELDLSATMASHWTNFASSGDPNHGPQLFASAQGDAGKRPRRQLQHWRPDNSPPKNCTPGQPSVDWPRFLGPGSQHIVFDLCNVTTQTAYRGGDDVDHCDFWEKLCANPESELLVACAFNRTGRFPHPP